LTVIKSVLRGQPYSSRPKEAAVYAGELMTRQIVTISPDTTVKEAIQQLNKHGITSMPVVDDENRLVGVVSEADLLREEVFDDVPTHVTPESWPEPTPCTVGDVMTTHVLSVSERIEAVDIARVMHETGVKSVPVVRDRKVIGVVSRSDIIHALATNDERIRDETQALLADADLPGWSVAVDDGEVVLTGPDGSHDGRIAEILTRTVTGVTAVRVVINRPVSS
jgi:CBS domain-containing protein